MVHLFCGVTNAINRFLEMQYKNIDFFLHNITGYKTTYSTESFLMGNRDKCDDKFLGWILLLVIDSKVFYNLLYSNYDKNNEIISIFFTFFI